MENREELLATREIINRAMTAHETEVTLVSTPGTCIYYFPDECSTQLIAEWRKGRKKA